MLPVVFSLRREQNADGVSIGVFSIGDQDIAQISSFADAVKVYLVFNQHWSSDRSGLEAYKTQVLEADWLPGFDPEFVFPEGREIKIKQRVEELRLRCLLLEFLFA